MNVRDEITFACPDEMRAAAQKVFAGKYSVTYAPSYPPAILDIGANCGAFALWASAIWPGAKIHCYEPGQISFSYLTQNLAGYGDVTLTRAAVLASDKTKLYVGKRSPGEASFCPDLEQTDDTYEVPPVIHPGNLPKADILKVSTNGCEFEIILGLNRCGLLPEVILLDYCREADRRAIDIELRDYDLVGSLAERADFGTVKYLRRQT